MERKRENGRRKVTKWTQVLQEGAVRLLVAGTARELLPESVTRCATGASSDRDPLSSSRRTPGPITPGVGGGRRHPLDPKSSYSAKAEYPVRRSFSFPSLALWN